mmetsp:Transcript_16374/g.19929  ORF Transcript_16374/g.19929 Transcript_16374/m.19929 type:complete len:384 (-) Transcript_16374:540-1691(-)
MVSSNNEVDEIAGTHEELGQKEIQRRLHGLASIESDYSLDSNYIQNVQIQGMTAEWRNKIICWYNQLQNSYDLDAITIFSAINFLDRFLSLKSCDSLNFRLAAIGALFLAAKLEEKEPIFLHHFCVLSEHVFQPCDIRLMELELLKSLKWHLSPPTPLAFADLLAGLFPSFLAHYEQNTHIILDLAKRLLNDTLHDYDFLKFSPSMRAVTAITCVMKEYRVPSNQVLRWLQIVNACGFQYRDSPIAAELMQDCGTQFFDKMSSYQDIHDTLYFDDDDEEVQLALQPTTAHADRKLAPSPNDITNIDSIYEQDQATDDAARFLDYAHQYHDEPPHFDQDKEEIFSTQEAEVKNPFLQRADSISTVATTILPSSSKRCRFNSSEF